jgi:hypothetical protein
VNSATLPRNSPSRRRLLWMVESYSTGLCAVLALREECLNGHRNVIRNLRRSRQTPEGIAHAQEAQAESLQGFVERSRELFAALSSGDQPRCSGEWIAQSLCLIRMLPRDTQEHPRMTPAPELCTRIQRTK